ncbi:hypothetical protein SAMN05421664_1128 [Chryseobacterium soldanellicola]|uniref:Uncharacterized protein n=1 Tax=Chryseobacterium soldanellicola TaxID=311333 RepID=A0A1H0ZXA4_9FLAO|nr:hypothetical protein [Chryseobacterium soldanellicola]SDQ32067.1 hypothetical protein SAMN05421664_1128 [Chryseobacterium soldanellicola]
MKSIFIKALLIINLFFIYNCKAQTANDYITFYNGVVPKLKSIIPNKTQFYGQNFSSFYNELQNKNVNIVMISYDSKIFNDPHYYTLYLYFCDRNMLNVASDNSFQYPWLEIAFENEIPSQIKDMVLQYHGQWNTTFAQFFSNMKIEKIKFIGVRGYDSPDYSAK